MARTAANGTGKVQAVIQVQGLTKRYGDYTAVPGVDLEVRTGEIFALLGPNGAGNFLPGVAMPRLMGVVADISRSGTFSMPC